MVLHRYNCQFEPSNTGQRTENSFGFFPCAWACELWNWVDRPAREVVTNIMLWTKLSPLMLPISPFNGYRVSLVLLLTCLYNLYCSRIAIFTYAIAKMWEIDRKQRGKNRHLESDSKAKVKCLIWVRSALQFSFTLVIRVSLTRK